MSGSWQDLANSGEFRRYIFNIYLYLDYIHYWQEIYFDLCYFMNGKYRKQEPGAGEN